MGFAKFERKSNRIIVTFSGTPSSKQDAVAYIHHLKELYSQQIKFVIIYDARKVGWVSQKMLKHQAMETPFLI